MEIFTRRTCSGFCLLWTAITLSCGWWDALQPAPGPVPLGPPGTTIARLNRERSTFETTFTETFWNDGRSVGKAADRVKMIMDSAPQQLINKLNMTRKAIDLRGGAYDQHVFDARAVVVALNPDVVIVSLGERKPPRQPGELDKLSWSGMKKASGGCT